MTDPGPPSDNTTLAAVLDGYARAGWDLDFVVGDDGTVRCPSCDHVRRAEDVQVASLRRLEGASDPADMAAVVALQCDHCGGRGTAVTRYGPEASIGEATLLLAAKDQRGQLGVPAAEAPDVPGTADPP